MVEHSNPDIFTVSLLSSQFATKRKTMLAMQYTFNLPDDYDMALIRARVAERGHLFDEMDGLCQKAFLISERHVEPAQGNMYAPFYVWHDVRAMQTFLLGDKFKAVTAASGTLLMR
jgi:Domain of unknown function (DUF4865)